MADCLSTYHIELTTRSPIFIGDGNSLNKKEYIRKGKMIYVPDVQKMYYDLQKRRLAEDYEDYMLNDRREDLGSWLVRNKIPFSETQKWIRYTLNCGDISLESKGQMEMKSFIKDAYGCPYIPGSSLKGALRTVLLAYILKKEEGRYEKNKREIMEQIRSFQGKREYFLQKQTKDLEVSVFNRLGKKADRPYDVQNAVNDLMSGFRVSDSKPISPEALTMCQKIDLALNGKLKTLNVVRECIRPNTKIEFELTLDNSFPYSIDEIKEALKSFASCYFNCYHKFFYKTQADLKPPCVNYIWLGGGVGYVSKTVVYNFFGKKDGLSAAAGIMQKTVRDPRHGHREDSQRGVSPHVLKCTKYQGKIYEFGQCAIRII